jgi:hypothetical protein
VAEKPFLKKMMTRFLEYGTALALGRTMPLFSKKMEFCFYIVVSYGRQYLNGNQSYEQE